MWARVQEEFASALERTALGMARIVPGLLVVSLVLLASFVVACLVRIVLRRALRRIVLDRRAHALGLGAFQERLPGESFTEFAAGVGFWTVIMAGLLIGVQVFDTTTALALRALAFLPQALVALLLFGLALALSRFLERAALIAAVNMQLPPARLLSLGVKWLVLLFGCALALQQLGIGGMLLTISFSILFGGVVLATALAAGLGSRDVVKRAWDDHHQRRGERAQDVRHF